MGCSSEQQILLYVTIWSLVLFIGLGVFFGIAAIRSADDNVSLDPDAIVHLVSITTGALLLILGNLMPKARRNSFFGLRTRWSMSSDSVWQKSQRFGGISAILCGLMMVILTLVLPGTWNLWALTGLMLLWGIASTLASYRYWKDETAK